MSMSFELMMKKKANYELLEYLRATGEQYIDTGYIPNQNSKVEIVVEVLDRTNSPYLFGNGVAWENSAFALALNKSTDIGLIFCYGNNTSNRAGVFAINQKYKVTMSKDGCEIYRYSSSSIIYSKGAYSLQTFSANANALIFWAMNLGEDTAKAKMKLYSCKIWENDVLVRDYVPVRRLSHNSAGLLDVVNNTFYGNAGTGEFLGSDQMILTTVGSPTITDGVVSGFVGYNDSPISYVKTDSNIDFDTNFKFVLDVETGTTLTGTQTISSRANRTSGGFTCSFFYSTQFEIKIFNSSATNVFNQTFTLSEATTTNSKYRFTIERNDTNYIFTLQKANGDVVLNQTVAVSTIGTSGFSFGGNLTDTLYTAFKGSIDFNTSYLLQNGTKYKFTIGA